jgi:hypothetical protein
MAYNKTRTLFIGQHPILTINQSTSRRSPLDHHQLRTSWHNMSNGGHTKSGDDATSLTYHHVPDLERSLIVHPTPWKTHIANYKYCDTVTISWDPLHLLVEGTKAYGAQDLEVKRLAAENDKLRNWPV